MIRIVYALLLSLHLASPVLAQEADKSPLSYSLREYGLILAIAMLGGFVRWYHAVRQGKAIVYDLRVLVGELFTSAFIGILTFWACEAMNFPPLMTAALAGMAGHQGVSALLWAEKRMKKFFDHTYGSGDTDRAPPDKE